MLRTFVAGGILLGTALTPLAIRAAAPIELKSVTVDLPFGNTMFPAAPGSDAANNNCLACHSADMVLNQPALPKATWTAEVDKMISVYKAPVAPQDVGPIVDYLATIRGAT